MVEKNNNISNNYCLEQIVIYFYKNCKNIIHINNIITCIYLYTYNRYHSNNMINITEKIESARYVVVGNVDSGKSTTIGVLTKNVLDNGNGYARNTIVKYKHERESGRTSTSAPYYMVKNNEIVTLIDLCGHRKYLKTTVFGITGLFADYGILIIESNKEILKQKNSHENMTDEHITLLISNRIPFIVLFTKSDISTDNLLKM